MKDVNYARTINVTANPSDVFIALTADMGKWWTEPDAPLKAVGDRAKFTFPPAKSYWTFEAKVLQPGRRVELECVDALHLHEGLPSEIETEWLGTKAVFDIQERDDGTKIHFVHHGLKPDLLCYDVCEAGWDMFFLGSLQAYLDTGVGKPHTGSA